MKIHKDNTSITNLLSGLGPAVLQSIMDPFHIISSDYTIIWMNKGMGEIYHINPDDVIGEKCYKIIFKRDDPCTHCIIKEVLKTGRTYITEKSVDSPDGRKKYGEVRAYPVRDDENNISTIIVIVIDITSKKELFEQQKSYNEKLSRKIAKINENEQTNLPEDVIKINENLSDREKEVLRLIIEGFTNNQISHLLEISHHTVKSHVINIFNKLGVNDRTQAAVIATRHKIV